MRIVALDGCLFENLSLIVSQVYLHYHLSLATWRDRRIVPGDCAPSLNPDALNIEEDLPGVPDGEFVFDFSAFQDHAEIIFGLLYLNRRVSRGRRSLLPCTWRRCCGESGRGAKSDAKSDSDSSFFPSASFHSVSLQVRTSDI
jgi:hypothetical protein